MNRGDGTMRVIIHAGAHHTDDDRILKCLLRNKEDFSRRGIAVPGPGKYRSLLKESFNAMEVAEPAAGARDVLIDAILDEENAERLILSNAHFFGSQRFAVVDGLLYPLAEMRMAQLCRLFQPDQVEMAIALRNPATFLPAVLGRASAEKVSDTLRGLDPRQLRWSDMLIRLRAALPDLPLTVWCNEDTPLLWAEIIRDLAGLPAGEKIVGGFDLLGELMSAEGMQRFRAYLKQHPTMTDIQKRRVIAAFLGKFGLEDALEEELDLPGWTDALVDEMTDLYDEDILRIQQIPGLRLLTP